jgi:hypothetical protein
MRAKIVAVLLLAGVLASLPAFAQAPPPLVRFSGVVRDAQGAPRTGTAMLTFAVYANQQGGTALWSETQSVTLDAQGRYTVVLGATEPDGLPVDLFTSGTAQWLGVSVDQGPEAPRVLLVSVPYALKAADATTIGGKPLSAFVLAGTRTGTGADGLTYMNTQGLTGAVQAAGAPGQTGNVGTPNYLGMFQADGTDLVNSVMYQNGSNDIGVNTTSPLAPFHVAAPLAPAAFFDVYSPVLTALPVVYRAARGTPSAPSAVQTGDILGGLAVRGFGASVFSSGGRGQVVFVAAENWTDAAQGTALLFKTNPTGAAGAPPERMRITPAGYVGIGTSTPDSQLTVYGVPGGTTSLHVQGDTQVDGNIAAKYQDVAEWVESGTRLEPGTVVVVDPSVVNGVTVSTTAYDVGVAGAVSAQPGVSLGERKDSRSLVAQSGRVKVKVDASYGAVKAGDLLVTSPTPGYAMVSQPVVVNGVTLHRPGTIVGKALEPLSAGQGEILVLLTLQ